MINLGKSNFAINGLMFGGSEFIPEENESLSAIDGVYSRHYEGKSVIRSDLLRDFRNGHFQNNLDDVLKVSMILIVHFFLFAPDPRFAVPLWLWMLVENLDMFGKFPWGTFSFQRLYHCLDGISEPDEGCDVQLNIHGFLMPFQIWACEMMPEFVRGCGMVCRDMVYREVLGGFARKKFSSRH